MPLSCLPTGAPPAQTSKLSLRSSGLRNSECRSLRSQVHRVVSARRAFAEAISGRTSAALRAGYSQSEFAARWGGKHYAAWWNGTGALCTSTPHGLGISWGPGDTLTMCWNRTITLFKIFQSPICKAPPAFFLLREGLDRVENHLIIELSKSFRAR